MSCAIFNVNIKMAATGICVVGGATEGGEPPGRNPLLTHTGSVGVTQQIHRRTRRRFQCPTTAASPPPPPRRFKAATKSAGGALSSPPPPHRAPAAPLRWRLEGEVHENSRDGGGVDSEGVGIRGGGTCEVLQIQAAGTWEASSWIGFNAGRVSPNVSL